MASCSHWWHAPTYFTISVVLAYIAISTVPNSPSRNPTTPPISHKLSLNASAALRRSGFNIISTLLSISPEIFLSSPNSTIFAIQDSALTNASNALPPWFLRHLLQYHTSPLVFSMADLLNKPQGICFPTLVYRKNVAVTKVDANQRFLEINHVLVSHPDIFLEGNLAIHGVLGPFSSMGSQDFDQILDSIQAPICDANSSLILDASDPKNMIEWTRIVRLLSFNGFVSFAIGLNSVLDGILKDYSNLNSVTIFCPPELALVASPSPMLDKIGHAYFQFIQERMLPKLYAKTLLLKQLQQLIFPSETGLMQLLRAEFPKYVLPESEPNIKISCPTSICSVIHSVVGRPKTKNVAVSARTLYIEFIKPPVSKQQMKILIK
ncbi:conserved hypothetical protein [Ricinus communis]|uniref:FAS1 domain-containing protein n=1 Tax=Ricinus communis TaxID=3988 RepID=B9S9N5_RICCO|nr:conserved hypothetical protein [Ricinus communis]